MSVPDPITDHEDQALDRLIEHFAGGDKPILHGLIRTYVGRIQGLENEVWKVIWGRLLDPAPGQTLRAEGKQLDVLGKIVGAERDGLSDDDYRLAIRLQIRVNRSFGTAEDLIQVTRLALGIGPTFTYEELIHKTSKITVEAVTVGTAIALHRALNRARAAGYRAQLSYYTDRVDPSDVFRFGFSGSGGNLGFGFDGDGAVATAIEG